MLRRSTKIGFELFNSHSLGTCKKIKYQERGGRLRLLLLSYGISFSRKSLTIQAC
jgi:hypothetical protein